MVAPPEVRPRGKSAKLAKTTHQGAKVTWDSKSKVCVRPRRDCRAGLGRFAGPVQPKPRPSTSDDNVQGLLAGVPTTKVMSAGSPPTDGSARSLDPSKDGHGQFWTVNGLTAPLKCSANLRIDRFYDSVFTKTASPRFGSLLQGTTLLALVVKATRRPSGDTDPSDALAFLVGGLE